MTANEAAIRSEGTHTRNALEGMKGMSTHEVRTYTYYADGEWRHATSGRTFDVHQPFNGQLYAKVAAGGAEDARIAVSLRRFPRA